jgi:hypothetical protein
MKPWKSERLHLYLTLRVVSQAVRETWGLWCKLPLKISHNRRTGLLNVFHFLQTHKNSVKLLEFKVIQSAQLIDIHDKYGWVWCVLRWSPSSKDCNICNVSRTREMSTSVRGSHKTLSIIYRIFLAHGYLHSKNICLEKYVYRTYKMKA